MPPIRPAGPACPQIPLEHTESPDGRWRTVRTASDAPLPAGVLAYNEFDLRTEPRVRLELPNPHVSLVVLFEGGVEVPGVGSFTSLVRGPWVSAGTGRHAGRLRGVEILLEPWLAWQALDTPIDELARVPVPLDCVLGRDGERLADQLADAPGPQQRLGAMLSALRRAPDSDGPRAAPQVLAVWQSLTGSHGRARISDLVGSTGWSANTMERRFAEQIGHTPKRMARVLRLRQALRLLATGQPPACVASSCGFSDQAHLGREVKEMTGLSPARITALRAVAADAGGPPQDRVRNQATSLVLCQG